MTKVDLPEKKVTLEECSKNDNGEPVTHLKNKVYCFDTVSEMEAMLYRRKKKLSSAVAIYIDEQEKIYFFEFKNVPHNHVSHKGILEKMHDSILTWQVCQNSEKSLDELMEKSTYFVIYNDSHYEGQRENESSSLESLKKQMKKLAKIETEEELLWETEIYQNTFYREIHTIDVDVFERKYAKKIFAGMK